MKMNCHQVQKLQEAYVDGLLAADTGQALEAHLTVCVHCAARLALARRVHQELGPTLSQGLGEPRLSLAAESRIRARLWEASEPTRPLSTWRRGVAWGLAAVLAVVAIMGLALVAWPWLALPQPATYQAWLPPPAPASPVTALALLSTPPPGPTGSPVPSPTGTASPTPAHPVDTPTPTPAATRRPATSPSAAPPAPTSLPPTPTAVAVTPSAVMAGLGRPATAVAWKYYLPGEAVTCVIQHGPAVWAGTADGQVVHLNTATEVLTRYTLSQGTAVSSLVVDGAGQLWAATRGQGVFVLAAPPVVTNTTWVTHTAATDDVSALAVDAAGMVWCGTSGGKVGRFAPAEAGKEAIWQSWGGLGAEAQVTALAVDVTGDIWVGVRGRYLAGSATYDGGLYRLRIAGARWERVLSSEVGIVQAIFVRSDGHLWVATSPTGDASNPRARGGGVVVWDGQNWMLYEAVGAGLPSRHVTTVAVDARHRTWIATTAGLVIYDGTQRTLYQAANSGLASDHIYDIFLDDTGGAWLATAGGLCRLLEQ